MKTGKLPESMLERSVFKQIRRRREDVISGAKAGYDSAIIDTAKKQNIAVTTAPVWGSCDLIGYIGVVHAINNLRAAGAAPIAVEDCILLPEDFSEPEFRKIIAGMEEAAEEAGIQICGGHTQITAAVNEPVLTVTGIGEAEHVINPKEAVSDMDVVVTKWAGLEGGYLLSQLRKEDILGRYSQDFLQSLEEYRKHLVITSEEAQTAVKHGVAAMHDIGEGGIFGALWELSRAAGTGLYIDIKKIPVKQETIEACELFDINPYALKSSGALLIICNRGYDLVEEYRKIGINASVIGKTTDSNDKILVNEDEVRYLEPPKRDEIYRI